MCPKKTTMEDFEPDVSGFFDDFDSPVIKARFGEPPANYKAKAEGIGIHLTFDQKFTPSDGSGERNVEQFYSIGRPEFWEIKDGGKEVVNTKNPDKHAFNQNTSAWSLIEKMIIHVGDGDIKKGSEIFSKRDHYMTEAAFYLGLNYHWKQQKVLAYRGEKERKEVDMLLPEKFLGEVKPGSVGAPAVESSELDDKLVELAHGKDAKEIKQAVIKSKDFKGQTAYIREVINGTKIKNLEDAGLIMMDDETKKYV